MRRLLVPLAAAGILLGATPGAGARIRAVRIGSPADQAGIRAGDEVLAAGGRDIRDFEQLSDALEAPGRSAIAVRRDGGIRIFMLDH